MNKKQRFNGIKDLSRWMITWIGFLLLLGTPIYMWIEAKYGWTAKETPYWLDLLILFVAAVIYESLRILIQMGGKKK